MFVLRNIALASLIVAAIQGNLPEITVNQTQPSLGERVNLTCQHSDGTRFTFFKNGVKMETYTQTNSASMIMTYSMDDRISGEYSCKAKLNGGGTKESKKIGVAEIEGGVKMVVQNYELEINKRLNTQIQKELMASYMYQAYASFFQRADIALPGIKKFFADAALEEREHAQMLIDYVNTRGGHVALNNIELNTVCTSVVLWAKADDTGSPLHDDHFCICKFVSSIKVENVTCSTDASNSQSHVDWQSGLLAFQDALVTERFVNKELLALQAIADEYRDAHLTHILEHHFLDEQVQSINQLANYVTRLKSFTAGGGSNYKLGEYMFDTNLNK